MNKDFDNIFQLGELIDISIIDHIEKLIKPYKKYLEEAKVYDVNEEKELKSNKRQKSYKAIIENEDLREYLITNILPLINKVGINKNHIFEILPGHIDYIEYIKDGFFDEHIDFINNHTNFTQQYTCIIGLENCLSGQTYVWDDKRKDYNGYEESIMKGGMIWFKSDLRHFGEKFEDNDKKKKILTISLRAIRKEMTQDLENMFIFKSKEGELFYVLKELCKNTLFEELNNITDKNGREEEDKTKIIETDLTNEELKLMIKYLSTDPLEVSESLNLDEISKIQKKLALYMIIPSEYKSCKVPHKALKELNERWIDKDYIYFKNFEPWMVDWAKEMEYVPFQVVYHWNDLTEYLPVSVEYYETNEQDNFANHVHGRFLRREMKKKISGEKDYGKKIYKQLNMISSYSSLQEISDNYFFDNNSYTIMNENLEFEKQWIGSDYTIMYGNCQYLAGDNILGKMCKKLNNHEKIKNKSTINKMKNLIHFHMYNLFKFNMDLGYDFCKDYRKRKSDEEFKKDIKYGDYYSCLLGLENSDWKRNDDLSDISIESDENDEKEDLDSDESSGNIKSDFLNREKEKEKYLENIQKGIYNITYVAIKKMKGYKQRRRKDPINLDLYSHIEEDIIFNEWERKKLKVFLDYMEKEYKNYELKVSLEELKTNKRIQKWYIYHTYLKGFDTEEYSSRFFDKHYDNIEDEKYSFYKYEDSDYSGDSDYSEKTKRRRIERLIKNKLDNSDSSSESSDSSSESSDLSSENSESSSESSDSSSESSDSSSESSESSESSDLSSESSDSSESRESLSESSEDINGILFKAEESSIDSDESITFEDLKKKKNKQQFLLNDIQSNSSSNESSSDNDSDIFYNNNDDDNNYPIGLGNYLNIENNNNTEEDDLSNYKTIRIRTDSDEYKHLNKEPSLDGMSTIKSNDYRFYKARIDNDDDDYGRMFYMEKQHDVHFELFKESFENMEISEEDKERIKKAVLEIPIQEARDYRDNIFKIYYHEYCNEGNDIFQKYKFKVYYVYYGFLKKKN